MRTSCACAAIVALTLVILGCGVRFANIPQFNKELPSDFKSRVFWTQTDNFKYNLEQLAGHVIYSESKAGEFSRGPRYIKANAPPALRPIDDGTVYQSKIDSSASVQGSYLIFAGNMKAEQTADVLIVDTAQVFIEYENVPVAELEREARKPRRSGQSAYYIQAVLLASVTTKYGSKIAGDASGVVGNTFGAKGNVYNEEDAISKDVRISLLLIDLDRYRILKDGAGARPMSSTEMLQSARAVDIEVKAIGQMDALMHQ